jgi:NAD(P)-dependent dehydrogenase (short-subunit alcohol dehydrogenase family)
VTQQFEGKVVVITGAGAGLGRECALLWASEGGRIVVTDEIEKRAKDVAEEIADAGGSAIGRQADVTIVTDVGAAVRRRWTSTAGSTSCSRTRARRRPASARRPSRT